MAAAKPSKDCIIHCVDESATVIALKDFQSWQTLLCAAEIRGYSPLLHYKDVHTVPAITYHSKCRKLFTMKRDLDNIKKKETPNVIDTETSRCSLRINSPTAMKSSLILEPVCIFCGKYEKYKNRERIPLNSCLELRADNNLREAAKRKFDLKIIAIASGDIGQLVASEAKYHKICYRDYTRPPKLKPETLPVCIDECERKYEDAENEAFEELCDYWISLTENPRVVKYQDLVKILEEGMRERNETIKQSSRKNLKRKLERRFDKGIIFERINSVVHAYPPTLTLQQILPELIRLSKLLNEINTFNDSERIVHKAAKILRTEMKNTKDAIPWPAQADDLRKEKISITHFADMFFNSLLSGTSTPSDSTRVNRLKMSFYQDLVYAVTNGQVKTVKSILFSSMIKNLTNNTELLRFTNLLGHGVSYCVLEEIETAAAISTIEKQINEVYIPDGFPDGVFTMTVFDNIDRREETKSGGNTSHRVNGIIIQPKGVVKSVKRPLPEAAAHCSSKRVCLEDDVSSMEKDVGQLLDEMINLVEHNEATVQENQQDKREVNVTPMIRKRSLAGYMPTVNFDYVSGKRVVPEPKSYPCNNSKDNLIDLQRKKYFIWSMFRIVNPTAQYIPSWTGFHIQMRSKVPIMESNVGYLDTIDNPATDISTVFEMMKRADAIKERLHLPSMVIVLDQAMYAKACEVKFKKKEQFKDIVLFMGTFHTLMMILGVTGKRFGDAGFRDVVIQSGVIQEGSIEGVLSGKMYNRSIYAHKTFYEALQRLLFKLFFEWLEKDGLSNLFDTETIQDIYDAISPDQYESIIDSDEFQCYFSDYERFISDLESENNHLTIFWLSYMEMVSLILDIIFSTRTGNWALFIESIRDVIPWAFAYDRYNYSRYLLVFLGDMLDLESSHPDVYNAFLAANFSVQLSDSNTFGRNEADKTIENTVNKDTKTPGGLTGFSLKQSACDRWIINAGRRAACYRNFKEMVEFSGSTYNHPDLGLSRIKKDEINVQAIVSVFETTFSNPFEGYDLIGLSSGKKATPEIENDLLNAKERGKIAMEGFKVQRLSKDSKISFFEKLKMLKLKTFSDLTATKKAVSNGKEVILRADKELLGRMAIIAQARSVDAKEVFSYPLGPIPWALAGPLGEIRKTNKAVLLKEVTKGVLPVEASSFENSATIIDGMALVQSMVKQADTFGGVAKQLLQRALALAGRSSRVDIVFDVYEHLSIKNLERKRRSSEKILLKNITAGHKVRQWKKILASSANKTELINFLYKEWRKAEFASLLRERCLYVTCDSECTKITNDSSEIVREMTCSHEEADTRLVFHAKHTSENEYDSILIVTPDTDVAVICLSFSCQLMSKVYIRTLTGNKVKILGIDSIKKSIGLRLSNDVSSTVNDFCDALVALHAYTGCDSVSAFAGKGKSKAFKLLLSSSSYIELFKEFGKSWEINDDERKSLESFTCDLYGEKGSSINDVRYKIYCLKDGNISSEKLPPCSNALLHHMKRACYQARVWRLSTIATYELPPPQNHGWEVKDGKLSIVWFNCKMAPDQCMDLLSCVCKKECVPPSCCCIENNLPCTDMCKIDCENKISKVFEEHDVDE